MQFIEKNSFNVRSAVYHLKKAGSGLEFLLFPMIHVGTKEFYDEVSARLSCCDLVLAEGVRSKKVNILTLSYRVIGKIRRMDLVTQSEMNLDHLRGKIMNSDLEAQVFDRHWSSFPIHQRVEQFIYVPFVVLYLLLFGTRDLLAEHLALEDLPNSEELLFEDVMDSLFVDERDRKLIRVLAQLDDEATDEKQVVGVLYGAAHMRNTMRFLLDKLKYRIAKTEWVTVFDL
jgi:hypothetical protein